jgi:hypothetical protein
MKKVVITSIVIFLASGFMAAQEVSVAFQMGVATYRMKSQKDLQDDFRGQVLPWKPVDEFPPYWIYGGSLSLHLAPRFGTSVSFEYGSTGGKLHYEDYSGSAHFTQRLRYTQFALGMFVQVNRSDRWPIFITVPVSISRTREELSYSVVVGSSKEEDSESFKAINLGIRPGVMMHRRLNAFVFQANLGCELQLPGRLESDGGQILLLENGDNVYAQWSGLRASLGIGLMLSKTKD